MRNRLTLGLLVIGVCIPFDTMYWFLTNVLPYLKGCNIICAASFLPTPGGVEAFIKAAKVGWVKYGVCWQESFTDALLL